MRVVAAQNRSQMTTCFILLPVTVFENSADIIMETVQPMSQLFKLTAAQNLQSRRISSLSFLFRSRLRTAAEKLRTGVHGTFQLIAFQRYSSLVEIAFVLLRKLGLQQAGIPPVHSNAAVLPPFLWVQRDERQHIYRSFKHIELFGHSEKKLYRVSDPKTVILNGFPKLIATRTEACFGTPFSSVPTNATSPTEKLLQNLTT